MKKYLVTLAAGLFTGLALSVWAAQDTDISNVEVRDPIRLEAYLEANASDAQSRLATVETTMPSSTLISNATLKVYGSNIVIVAGGTLNGKTLSFATLTNLVYDGGATTGNVNIVSWATP